MLTGSVVLLRYSLIVFFFFLNPTLSSGMGHAGSGRRGGHRGCARHKFRFYFKFCSLFHGIIDPPNPQSLTSVLYCAPTKLSEEALPNSAKIAGLSQIVEASRLIIWNSPSLRPFVAHPRTDSANREARLGRRPALPPSCLQAAECNGRINAQTPKEKKSQRSENGARTLTGILAMHTRKNRLNGPI